MPFLTIAAKDLRLLLRDPRSAVILLVMPLVLILVLGLSLGEAFGRKPDDRIAACKLRSLQQPQRTITVDRISCCWTCAK